MRRRAPRPLRLALETVVGTAAPAGLLPRVQAAWADAVGPAVAGEAQPVGEREGVVRVACRSSVWAHELELLGPEIVDRLNARLGVSEGRGGVRELRFVTRS